MSFLDVWNGAVARDEWITFQTFRVNDAQSATSILQTVVPAIARNRLFLVASAHIRATGGVAQVAKRVQLQLNDGTSTFEVAGSSNARADANTAVDFPLAITDQLIIPPGYSLQYLAVFDAGANANTAACAITGYLLPRGSLQ